MKRRRANHDESKPAMFPFLDVLICTAGTLIILLIVITSMAWEQAEQAVVEAPVAPVSTEDQKGTWVSRAAQAEEARGDVSKVVAERRVELGYLEQQLRDQQMKIVELDAAVKAGNALATASDEQLASTEAELGRLEKALKESTENVKELKEANKDRKKAYSIIPYEGPNGTTRIPIYIECRADRVVVYPGGTELNNEDFLLCSDPGNPLATMMRATREHVVAGRSITSNEEPYPLILIRPEGIAAYYNVRQSLQGWTSEFGYEFIDEDWKLKFPTTDPKLFEVQQRALAESRLRNQAMVAALRRKAKRGGTFVAAPRAGIRNESGAGGTSIGTSQIEESDETGFGTPGFTGTGSGNNNGGGIGLGNGNGGNSFAANGGTPGGANGTSIGTSMTSDGTGTGASGTNNAGGLGTGNSPLGSGQRDSHGNSLAGNRSQNGNTNPALGSSGDGQYATQAEGNGWNRDATSGNSPGGTPDNLGNAQNNTAASGRMPNAGKPGGYSRTGQGDSPNANATANSADANSEVASRPGNSRSNSSAAGGGASGSSGDGGGSDVGGASSAMGAPSITLPPAETDGLAKQRGKNWGLRYVEPSATPITRPVRILCDARQMIILPDDRKRAPRPIAFTGKTQDSVDAMVTAVWDEIGRWGIAGKGMTWRPILTFDVQPGGEARYQEIDRMLKGSGLQVRRSASAEEARAPSNGGRR